LWESSGWKEGGDIATVKKKKMLRAEVILSDRLFVWQGIWARQKSKRKKTNVWWKTDYLSPEGQVPRLGT